MSVHKIVMRAIGCFLLGALAVYSAVCFVELFTHAYDLIARGNVCWENIIAFIALSLFASYIIYTTLEEKR